MEPWTRRSVIAGGAASVASAPLLLRAALTEVQPIPARRFADSVGLCTHPCWRNTVWGHSDWEDAVLALGVRNIRGEVAHGWSGEGAMQHLGKLFARGVKICALIPGQTLDRAAAERDVDFLVARVGAEHLSGIESINEYNRPKTAPRDWAARLRSFQHWLHDNVRAKPQLASIPLVAPSIWNRVERDCRSLGSLAPDVDRGNVHYYTGGRRPTRAPIFDGGEQALAEAARTARVVAPGAPILATEFGYDVAVSPDKLSPWAITERAAAKYMVRGLFDLFAAGVERTFVYSLIDDPGRDHYGLLDGALRPRKSFVALKNLMALFADSGRQFEPRPLGYRLAGNERAIKRLLFQKSDGVYLLVLYQDVDSYDRAARRDIAPAPAELRIAFDQPVATLRSFAPTSSGAAVAAGKNQRSFAFSVGDEVTVLEITPGRI